MWQCEQRESRKVGAHGHPSAADGSWAACRAASRPDSLCASCTREQTVSPRGPAADSGDDQGERRASDGAMDRCFDSETCLPAARPTHAYSSLAGVHSLSPQMPASAATANNCVGSHLNTPARCAFMAIGRQNCMLGHSHTHHHGQPRMAYLRSQGPGSSH